MIHFLRTPYRTTQVAASRLVLKKSSNNEEIKKIFDENLNNCEPKNVNEKKFTTKDGKAIPHNYHLAPTVSI